MEPLTLVMSPWPLASEASVRVDVANNPFGRLTTSGVALLERRNGEEWTLAFRLDSRRGDHPPSIQPLGDPDRLVIAAIARPLPLDFLLPSLDPGSYRFTLAVGISSDAGPYRRAQLHRAFTVR